MTVFICSSQIYLNGQRIYLFKHRLPVEKVNTVHINGDTVINVMGTVPVRYTGYSNSSV